MHAGLHKPEAARRAGRVDARFRELLAEAGIEVDGSRPWDMQVHDPAVPARVLAQGSLGLGESWMEGGWDCADLDGLLSRLLEARLHERVRGWADWLTGVLARVVNLQTRRRAREVGRRHYDLGNALYQAMLGRRMVYSCGYWREAADLDAAQEAKLDLVCRKLQLRSGLRLLDIGCGWGETLKFAAERYGVTGLGVTISEEQARYARELCRGLPVEIRLQDYRDVGERFDRICSIGMFEHVGVRNYRAYFHMLDRCLAEDGLTLLHTIGRNAPSNRTDPWIARYIFPNSMLPSASQITAAAESPGEGRLVLEDWHGFGPDYERTLQAWRANIEAAWPRLPARYDERFRRMWRFYLAASIAGFRVRHLQLWQLVYSRGPRGGYVAPR